MLSSRDLDKITRTLMQVYNEVFLMGLLVKRRLSTGSVWTRKVRLCAHEVVSDRFHNSQNENDMNYKSSYRIKFSVFVLRRGSCWFSVNDVNKSGNNKIIRNENVWKRHRVHVV